MSVEGSLKARIKKVAREEGLTIAVTALIAGSLALGLRQLSYNDGYEDGIDVGYSRAFDAFSTRSPSLPTEVDPSKCSVGMVLRAVNYRDLGGDTLPDGAPKYQANEDILAGGAEGLSYQIQTDRMVVGLKTDSQGVGHSILEPGFPELWTLIGANIAGAEEMPAMKFRLRSLQNPKDTHIFIIPCAVESGSSSSFSNEQKDGNVGIYIFAPDGVPNAKEEEIILLPGQSAAETFAVPFPADSQRLRIPDTISFNR